MCFGWENFGLVGGPGRRADATFTTRASSSTPHPAFTVHDFSRFVAALDTWRDHLGSFVHIQLELGLKRIALLLVRASYSRLARRSLITVVTGERKKILESHNTKAPVSVSFT